MSFAVRGSRGGCGRARITCAALAQELRISGAGGDIDRRGFRLREHQVPDTELLRAGKAAIRGGGRWELSESGAYGTNRGGNISSKPGRPFRRLPAGRRRR